MYNHVLTENIGFSRIGDNRWITQYKALLCVLNSKGQVLCWRLTPSLSFKDVQPDLTALKQRLDSQHKQLEEFYIDNCCNWRNKLQQVFGGQIKVYLDIFHAVKRLGEKIPKRHHLRKQCMMDWRMVFRDPSDQGERRHSPTPAPDILEKNLDDFLQRWKDVAYKGQAVLNAAALKEIANLRVHVTKGCLSGIAPGRGTNRNENLHKDLNKVMSCSKYGVELAYALLSVIFFCHNEKIAAATEHRLERPIQYYAGIYAGLDTGERFGLRFASECTSSGTQEIFREIVILICTYAQLYQRILNTPLPSEGHSRQQDSYGADEAAPEDACDHPTSDVECDDKSIHVSTLKHVLMRAVSWYFIHKSLENVSEASCISLDQIPFIISTLGDLSVSMLDATEEEQSAMDHLDILLKSWKLSPAQWQLPFSLHCSQHSESATVVT